MNGNQNCSEYVDRNKMKIIAQTEKKEVIHVVHEEAPEEASKSTGKTEVHQGYRRYSIIKLKLLKIYKKLVKTQEHKPYTLRTDKPSE